MVGNASRVLNIVSTGPNSGELYLTFTFEWDHSEIEKGSAEELEKQKQYQSSAPAGLAKTLEKIRDMVRSGELGGLGQHSQRTASSDFAAVSEKVVTSTTTPRRFSWFRSRLRNRQKSLSTKAVC